MGCSQCVRLDPTPTVIPTVIGLVSVLFPAFLTGVVLLCGSAVPRSPLKSDKLFNKTLGDNVHMRKERLCK